MLWKHLLSGRGAGQFIKDSKAEIDNFYGSEFYEVPPSPERHSVFMDDLANIDRMANKSSLTNADVRECSSILYKWLFDRWHPMLQELCNELGIQLTFPISTPYGPAGGNGGPLPTIGFQLGLGRRNLLGHRWDTRTAFGHQAIAIINGVPITVEMLVKFVRHKLGGGHLDVVDRKKWQKELLEISGHLVQDKDFMRIQMSEITRTVLDCVREHRIENHL